jgi:hypothetical protein|tara:strand:- start:19499 stop:19657 length:159 start_codon:yes stop_codon:yes gene_type:complete
MHKEANCFRQTIADAQVAPLIIDAIKTNKSTRILRVFSAGSTKNRFSFRRRK